MRLFVLAKQFDGLDRRKEKGRRHDVPTARLAVSNAD
jgi:hypothetical protein